MSWTMNSPAHFGRRCPVFPPNSLSVSGRAERGLPSAGTPPGGDFQSRKTAKMVENPTKIGRVRRNFRRLRRAEQVL